MSVESKILIEICQIAHELFTNIQVITQKNIFEDFWPLSGI